MKSRIVRFLNWLCLAGCLLPGGLAAAAEILPQDRILILVSLDGFRWDYPQKFKAPNISRLAAEGVHAEKLLPQFPSMTFPNHHTIVTGWRPARHGVIHNNIYDPVLKQTFAFNKPELQGSEWWGGEPIWATAIKQGRRANVLFWPGTGTKMAGLLPTEWKSYDGRPEPNEIVDQGLASSCCISTTRIPPVTNMGPIHPRSRRRWRKSMRRWAGWSRACSD